MVPSTIRSLYDISCMEENFGASGTKHLLGRVGAPCPSPLAGPQLERPHRLSQAEWRHAAKQRPTISSLASFRALKLHKKVP